MVGVKPPTHTVPSGVSKRTSAAKARGVDGSAEAVKAVTAMAESNVRELGLWVGGLGVVDVLTTSLGAVLSEQLQLGDPLEQQQNVLRMASGLSDKQIRMVVDKFSGGLERVLTSGCSKLRECFRLMDQRAADDQRDARAHKFATFKMACGDVNDFHKGLSERVGELF